MITGFKLTSQQREWMLTVRCRTQPADPELQQIAADGGTSRDFDALGERRRHRERERVLHRTPGWQTPVEAERWPLYANEAITVTTEWGPVTVGRNLARMYDLGGWPDAATLEQMARQQQGQERGPR